MRGLWHERRKTIGICTARRPRGDQSILREAKAHWAHNNILWAWPLVLNRFLNNCNYTMVYTWNYLLLQRNRRDYHQEDEEKKINKPSERCHFQFHNRSSLCFQHVYGIVFDNEIIEMIGCMCVRVRVRAAGSTEHRPVLRLLNFIALFSHAAEQSDWCARPPFWKPACIIQRALLGLQNYR